MSWQRGEYDAEQNLFIDEELPKFDNSGYIYHALFYTQAQNCVFYEKNQKVDKKIFIPALVIIPKGLILSSKLVIQQIEILNQRTKETSKYQLQESKGQQQQREGIQRFKEEIKGYQIYD